MNIKLNMTKKSCNKREGQKLNCHENTINLSQQTSWHVIVGKAQVLILMGNQFFLSHCQLLNELIIHIHSSSRVQPQDLCLRALFNKDIKHGILISDLPWPICQFYFSTSKQRIFQPVWGNCDMLTYLFHTLLGYHFILRLLMWLVYHDVF